VTLIVVDLLEFGIEMQLVVVIHSVMMVHVVIALIVRLIFNMLVKMLNQKVYGGEVVLIALLVQVVMSIIVMLGQLVHVALTIAILAVLMG